MTSPCSAMITFTRPRTRAPSRVDEASLGPRARALPERSQTRPSAKPPRSCKTPHLGSAQRSSAPTLPRKAGQSSTGLFPSTRVCHWTGPRRPPDARSCCSRRRFDNTPTVPCARRPCRASQGRNAVPPTSGSRDAPDDSGPPGSPARSRPPGGPRHFPEGMSGQRRFRRSPPPAVRLARHDVLPIVAHVVAVSKGRPHVGASTVLAASAALTASPTWARRAR